MALLSLSGPWMSQTRGFFNHFRHLVGFLWTSDQPVAKASTYTGQHNTKKRTNAHALIWIRTHDLSVQAINFSPQFARPLRLAYITVCHHIYDHMKTASLGNTGAVDSYSN
jgi:hypothetical protein